MPDSVYSPAPLKTVTLPSATSSVRILNGVTDGDLSHPAAGVPRPGAPFATCVTPPCCLTRADARDAGGEQRGPGRRPGPRSPRPRSASLTRLGHLAVDLRVDADVVERPGQDRHHDGARFGAAADRAVVVTALPSGDR